MARLFDDASSEYIKGGTPAVTDYPYSISCWFYCDDGANSGALVTMNNDTSGDNDPRHGLFIQSQNVRNYNENSSGGNAQSVSGNTFTVNAWSHAAGVNVTSASRTSVCNGDIGNKGSETTDITFNDAENTAIGSLVTNTPSNYFSGRIAEAAIWDTDLDDAQIIMLSKGYSPLMVQPQNLVFYAPLFRDEDRDIVSGILLDTSGGTPSVADHAPVIYPTGQILQFPPPAAVGGSIIPQAMHHYRQQRN